MLLRWKYTISANGQYGLWRAQTLNGKYAGGIWRTGSFGVEENDTNLSEDEWLAILDQCDFWQGPSEDLILEDEEGDDNDGATVGQWDGESLEILHVGI